MELAKGGYVLVLLRLWIWVYRFWCYFYTLTDVVVSHMHDIFTELAPLGRFSHRVEMSVAGGRVVRHPVPGEQWRSQGRKAVSHCF